jgi:hypothetical protein
MKYDKRIDWTVPIKIRHMTRKYSTNIINVTSTLKIYVQWSILKNNFQSTI